MERRKALAVLAVASVFSPAACAQGMYVELKKAREDKPENCYHAVLVGVNADLAECAICDARVPWGDRGAAGIYVSWPPTTPSVKVWKNVG